MNRRRFLAAIGAGLVAAPGRALAQDYSKSYPVNCTPPLPMGTPKPVTLIKRSLVPRKSAFDLSAAEVQKLRDAYAALRDLSTRDPNDPRGWRAQANVHCYYCSGGYDSLGVEIHGGWWFLPWHRCYLYMHERILAALVGDPNFRLPYWDWDTIPDGAADSRRTVPPAYSAASGAVTQPAPMSVANALFDRTRGATTGNLIPNSIVGKQAMATVMCQTGENFTGGPGLMGQLEASPHGPVHIWTGDPRTAPNQPAPFGCFFPVDYPYDPKDPSSYPADVSQVVGCTDMGVLGTAAQDPIFFSHHSNIDRLWSIWVQIAGHVNPADPNWLNTGWSFYDENKNWVTISVSQVLDAETNLGYSYQPPQAKGYTTTTAICGPPPSGRVSAPGAPTPAPRPFMVAEDQKGTAVGTKPHTQGVAVPQEQRAGLRSRAAGADQRRYVLHIDGISLPPAGGVIIRVFVNLPGATVKTDPDPAHFAGYVTVVPSGPGHRHQVVRNAAFDLTPELLKTVAATDQLSVTLVPVTAGGAEPAQGSVTYKRIYVTTE
jgi:polyphenol oxidase